LPGRPVVQVGGLPPPRAPVGAICNLTRDQRVRTQDPERGKVTAYQHGVWLGPGERARGGDRAGRGAAGVDYVVRFGSS
jgi:hypothetical protein